MDIAYLAVNHPTVKKVIVCHRNGFSVAPKVVPEPIFLKRFGKPSAGKPPNKPLDTATASLFDTMYVPARLQRGRLLWSYYDKFMKLMFFLVSGTSAGIDQWAGGLRKVEYFADSGKSYSSNVPEATIS